MATQTVEQLIDDVDGSPATVTLKFSFQGREYEIDLSDRNAANFEKVMSNWISRARRTGGRSVRSTKAAKAGRRSVAGARQKNVDLAAVREWARGEGFKVAEKGRVPGAVMEAYQTAHHPK